MPAKRWSWIVSILALLSFAWHGWAQADELTQQVALSDGFVVFVPDDWSVEDDEELGGFALTGESAGLFAFDPTRLAETFDIKEDDPLIDILIEVYRQFAGDRVRRTDVEEITIGAFPAAQYRYADDEFEGLFLVIDFGEGQLGLLDFYTRAGDLDDQLELGMAIAETFTRADVVIDPKTGLPIGTTSETTTETVSTTTSSTTSEPCTVSTNAADTVQLHVGPGLNRAVVAFLPTNTDFEVTGSFTTDDGSEWFQLDKNEAAPNSAASEIWVARENVDESGDCDSVADASAPPIVPIISNPPPQPTAAPGATAAPVEVGLIPADGDWTLTLDGTILASCEGTQTIRINTAEFFPNEPLSQIYRLRVNSGGASITFGGDVFTLTSPGNYFGTYTFDNGENGQIRLQVVSPTFMTGSGVGNFQIDGVPCSYTITLSARHN
jgi:hypothetical protein